MSNFGHAPIQECCELVLSQPLSLWRENTQCELDHHPIQERWEPAGFDLGQWYVYPLLPEPSQLICLPSRQKRNRLLRVFCDVIIEEDITSFVPK